MGQRLATHRLLHQRELGELLAAQPSQDPIDLVVNVTAAPGTHHRARSELRRSFLAAVGVGAMARWPGHRSWPGPRRWPGRWGSAHGAGSAACSPPVDVPRRRLAEPAPGPGCCRRALGQQLEQLQLTKARRAVLDPALEHQHSVIVDHRDVVMALGPNRCRTTTAFTPSPSAPETGRPRYGSSRKRVRTALMTRAPRPTIASA
jgi:hypothetical protein